VSISKRRAIVAAVVVIVLAIVASGIAFVLRAQPAVQEFMAQYPGVVEPAAGAPVGIPVWVNVTHFLNTLFLLLIIRTGLSIRSKKRPPAFWTPRRKLFGQAPRRMGINVWLHNTVDILWVLNGAVYLVLLFATGQWVRTVPTSWEVFPHALSALMQYLTFTWPAENPWVSYNALQVLAYFGVTFLLAPLAILSGKPVRWVHNVVLFLFLAFIVVHVDLVLFTGAVRNLNVMYAGNDGMSWLGTIIFVASLAVLAGVWFALTPGVQKRLASLTGTVS
jgi:thiosulfate reductase cytochrome b subunit